MSREDAKQGTGAGDECKETPTSAVVPALSSNEEAVLECLVASSTCRTVVQLATSTGLSREQAVAAIEGLREKGLITRFNTLVESYAARFPGLEVR